MSVKERRKNKKIQAECPHLWNPVVGGGGTMSLGECLKDEGVKQDQPILQTRRPTHLTILVKRRLNPVFPAQEVRRACM